MDNIILKGMLKEFANRHGKEEEKIESQFECFANYCLLKTDHYESFDFERVATGSSIGVDGLAVVISGVIVDDLEEARTFTKGQFDATFHFIQAKTSTSFDLGSFLKFSSTVRGFFESAAESIPAELKNAHAIKDHIYERAAKLRQLPSLELHYVYAGQFSVDTPEVMAAINAEVTALKARENKFSTVRLKICDSNQLCSYYRNTKNDLTKSIKFSNYTALPPIQGASAAYIGVAKCRDYVSLIEKDDGDINKGIFFENVRDFLGERNSVNVGIEKTIKTEDERDWFGVLNNGITIISSQIKPHPEHFEVSRFQVVNGCQTSHVLYKNREHLTDQMFITVKLIETSDIDLHGRIVATTNTQSPVNKEAFATIKPYHKKLEDFFSAMRNSGYRFYYERRSHQFDEDDEIAQHSVVSAPSLMKCFVSVVMEEPHKVHYYYGRLLEEYNREEASAFFVDSDSPGFYFAANLIVSKCRSSINRKSALNDWLFHISMLVKKQIASELSQSRALTDQKFLELLARIEANFEKAFTNASNVIKSANLSRSENRSPQATKTLIKLLGRTILPTFKAIPPPKISQKLADGGYVGLLRSFDESKGLATLAYGPFVFTSLGESAALSGQEGKRVRFQVKSGVVNSIELFV